MKCAKNVPRAGVGKNFNFFRFFEKFSNWRKASYFHIRTSKISKFTHLDEKGAKEWNAQKMSLGPGWGKTSIFSIFRKVFKTDGKHHIFTLGQLKYQNSLIWMKKEPKSEMRKKCPKGRGGEKLQFFSIFRKVYRTEGKHHIFTLGQWCFPSVLKTFRKIEKIEVFPHPGPRDIFCAFHSLAPFSSKWVNFDILLVLMWKYDAFLQFCKLFEKSKKIEVFPHPGPWDIFCAFHSLAPFSSKWVNFDILVVLMWKYDAFLQFRKLFEKSKKLKFFPTPALGTFFAHFTLWLLFHPNEWILIF